MALSAFEGKGAEHSCAKAAISRVHFMASRPIRMQCPCLIAISLPHVHSIICVYSIGLFHQDKSQTFLFRGRRDISETKRRRGKTFAAGFPGTGTGQRPPEQEPYPLYGPSVKEKHASRRNKKVREDPVHRPPASDAGMAVSRIDRREAAEGRHGVRARRRDRGRSIERAMHAISCHIMG